MASLPEFPDRPRLLHASELLAAGVLVVTAAAAGGVALYVTWRWLSPPDAPAGGVWDSAPARVVAVVVLALGALAWLWGRFVEPRLLLTTRIRVESEKLRRSAKAAGRSGTAEGASGLALRLAFVSDLHVERSWPAGRRLVERVSSLHPDAVLLGGDYLNSKTPRGVEALQECLRGLAEVAPVYAVPGNGETPDPSDPSDPNEGGASGTPTEEDAPVGTDAASAPSSDSKAGEAGEADEMDEMDEMDEAGEALEKGMPWYRLARPVLEGGGARVLENDSVELAPGVVLHGVRWLDLTKLERLSARLDRGRFNICLTHAPGLIPEAARAGFDLYLCGHTHGGQVRLPLYGAILTLAVHGKRFESGRYHVGHMTAHVTRGVGLELGLAPKVRFLCPPEVVLVELRCAT